MHRDKRNDDPINTLSTYFIDTRLTPVLSQNRERERERLRQPKPNHKKSKKKNDRGQPHKRDFSWFQIHENTILELNKRKRGFFFLWGGGVGKECFFVFVGVCVCVCFVLVPSPPLEKSTQIPYRGG